MRQDGRKSSEERAATAIEFQSIAKSLLQDIEFAFDRE
jgi:hypothetical protein